MLRVGGSQILDRIVIAGTSAVTITTSGPVKLRPQVMGWTGDFGRRLHAHAAGEAGGNHDSFAATGGVQFNHTLGDIYLGDAAAIDFDIKLGTADGNHRARSADLDWRGSAEMLLYP